MIHVPTHREIARLFKSISDSMLGMKFDEVESEVTELPTRARTAVVPIEGQEPITVGIATNDTSAAAITSAMFAVPEDEVDQEMMNDSLSELANIAAGQIKAAGRTNHQLGLPKLIPVLSSVVNTKDPNMRVVVLKTGRLEVIVFAAAEKK